MLRVNYLKKFISYHSKKLRCSSHEVFIKRERLETRLAFAQ